MVATLHFSLHSFRYDAPGFEYDRAGYVRAVGRTSLRQRKLSAHLPFGRASGELGEPFLATRDQQRRSVRRDFRHTRRAARGTTACRRNLSARYPAANTQYGLIISWLVPLCRL